MSSGQDRDDCQQAELVSAYVLQALPRAEAAALEAHLASCDRCRRELQSLRTTVDALAAWPTNVLRPTSPLQQRLAQRIAEDSGGNLVAPPARTWTEPQWDEVAPGISCKILAADEEKHVVSMLVRLEPGASYPPHTHAGAEELHLLDGELWIDERKLYPGDYNRGAPGDTDKRVWSETGCTCILITSTRDILR